LGEVYANETHAINQALEFIFTYVQPKLECIRLLEVFLLMTGVTAWFGLCVDDWKGLIEKWFSGTGVRLESVDSVLIEMPQPGEED
jgi:hypothetical protein